MRVLHTSGHTLSWKKVNMEAVNHNEIRIKIEALDATQRDKKSDNNSNHKGLVS